MVSNSSKIYFILSAVIALIAVFGFIVTAIFIFVIQPKTERIRSEISRLRGEIEEVHLRNSDVLDQASDIVLRANSQAQAVTDWMNSLRLGELPSGQSLVQLFDNEAGSILYANARFPGELLPDTKWEVVSHDIVDTHEIPTLWFLTDNDGSIYSVSFGNYNIETGKYTESVQGACSSKTRAEFDLYGNTPAGD